MFGMSGTELAIVLLLALLLLGPSKLPELARSLGKALRDFKRVTGDLRSTVESEFYRMDRDVLAEQAKLDQAPAPSKAQGTVASGAQPAEPQPEGALPDPYTQAADGARAAEAAAEATEPPQTEAAAAIPRTPPAEPKS